VLLAGVGYHGDDGTSEYEDTGVAVLVTRLEYQGDDSNDSDDSTSLLTVLDALSKEKPPPSPETSFFCIPRTKGSGLPSLAGACFNQHLPWKLPSPTF
jgi:hypothetical protein